MPVISIAQIRDRLETSLTGLLGTRTYSTATNDVILPALVIDYGRSQDIGGNVWAQKPKKVTGLEAVIEPQQQFIHQEFHSQQYGIEWQTTITLKQWDITENLLAATSAFIREFGPIMNPGTSARIPRSSQLDSVESQRFVLIHQIK